MYVFIHIIPINNKPPVTSVTGGKIFRQAATYSPTFAVPSALKGLTSLFGMDRGVSPSL